MTGLSGNLGGLSEADFPVAGARFECHFCMFVLGWAEFVPPCPRVSVPCLDFVAKHPPLMGTGIQASIGFFTCFLYIGIASFLFLFFYFFFPVVFWLLVEMPDSEPVPGDRSAGSWPDSPGGISKMQLNFCSLIRPTSPV